MDIRGFTVHDLWIEEASDIAAEYYASIILDRGEKKLLAMLSRMGGMDVEEIAETDPTRWSGATSSPAAGLDPDVAREIALDAGIDDDVIDQVAEMLVKLADVAVAEDATLIEINPLIVTGDRRVVALDSKMTIDGNALFRHPELAELTDKSAEDPQEAMAKEKGLTYVKLGGNIGILGNGAGLCMSTLDVVAQAGGKPANFLDAGGGSKAEAIVDALEVITSDRERQRDPVQHLRRDHPLRRDRQGDHRGLAADRDRACRWSSASTAPTRRRGWGCSPRPNLGNLHVEKTMLGAAKAVVELAGARRDA